MKLIQSIPELEYQAPESLQDALAALGTAGSAARLLAGGTDLLLQVKQRTVIPNTVVDVKRIPELNRLDWNEQDGLTVGAAVPLHRLVSMSGLPQSYDCLIKACSLIGSTQIRNRGTMVGNVCNAAPSADSVPPLLCLDARVMVAGSQSSRTIAIKDFFKGPGQTVLSPDEIVTEIVIPTPPPAFSGSYLRHTTRNEMDIALVGVASSIQLSEQGTVRSARIALGAVAPTPIRSFKAEDLLVGQPMSKALIAHAAAAASDDAKPITDVRSSADYRKEMVAVFIRRTLYNNCQTLGIAILPIKQS